MKIYCPKCHTCYSIETGLVPPDGKKMRCSRCGEVWLCVHRDMEHHEKSQEGAPQNVIANTEDVLIATPATETAEESVAKGVSLSEDEMNVIFSRLKEESTKIDTEKEKLSALKTIFPTIKKLLGWNNYLTIALEVFVVLLILGLSLFAYRYALVRKFPQLEVVYTQLGIPSRVIGEGLEFQNVVRHYDSPEKPRLLTIKGFIYNTTSKELDLPVVLVSIMNSEAQGAVESTHHLEQKTIAAQDKIAFTLQVTVPQQMKYIMLTFTE